ncbi:hypothetical protein HK100_007328 [Physocladia obscura]|uniref:Uncharacterized protein n=1 Tax=Physocladia obscura TaxID=109957 RepID=A0AAD5SRU0_9FUNG|nr:hypothetical protein HK100_007328 [Physocladia obscura]
MPKTFAALSAIAIVDGIDAIDEDPASAEYWRKLIRGETVDVNASDVGIGCDDEYLDVAVRAAVRAAAWPPISIKVVYRLQNIFELQIRTLQPNKHPKVGSASSHWRKGKWSHNSAMHVVEHTDYQFWCEYISISRFARRLLTSVVSSVAPPFDFPGLFSHFFADVKIAKQ